MSAWDNYDNWLLKGSGVDDNTPEVFNTEKFDLYSCDEDVINEFDELIEKATKDPSIYLNNKDDDDLSSLEDYKDHILSWVDSLSNLHSDSYGAINEMEENWIDEKEFALEQKYQQMKDDKLTGDN